MNDIQNLAYLTIFYGSITHLKLVRMLISQIMYMYADTFQDEDFYKITLKMLFLSGKRKKFKNLYEKLKIDFHFVNSKNFTKDLLLSLETLISFEKLGNEIFIYDIYGRNLEDEKYKEFETKMLDNIEINENYHMFYINDIFKSIPSNLSRFNDIKRLLEIMLDYIEKNYSRFFYDFGKILNYMDVRSLSEENFRLYKNIIDKLLTVKDKDNINISYAIINIKEHKPEIKDYDNILLKEKSFENIIYNLEEDNNIEEALKSIIEIYKERYEERERKPGLIVGYGTEYYIERSFFLEDVYYKKTRDIVIKDYIPLVKLIISSKNQFIREKIKNIKGLCYILLVEKDTKIREEIHQIIEKCEISEYKKSFMESREKTIEDLKNNLLMENYIAGKIEFNELISKYLESILIDKGQIEEIIECIKLARLKLEPKEEFDYKLFFYFFLYAYKENDIEIRNELIEMTDIFIGTKCEKEIIEVLYDYSDNLSYEESVGYLKLLRKIPKTKIHLYKGILEKLRNNPNYNIRVMVNKYLIEG